MAQLEIIVTFQVGYFIRQCVNEDCYVCGDRIYTNAAYIGMKSIDEIRGEEGRVFPDLSPICLPCFDGIPEEHGWINFDE